MMLSIAICALQGDDSYVRLAAALPASEWSSIERYAQDGMATKLPAFVPPNATPLDAAKALALRYDSLLVELKNVDGAAYAPNRPLLPLEIASLDRFEAFVVTAAHVRFADGARHDAVTLLIDGATMAVRIGSPLAETLITDAFRRESEGIPLEECERIRKAVDGYLVGRSAVESRRRLILVRLRMRVEAYRWSFGKPPDRLIEGAPSIETIDPRTGSSFRYERKGSGYQLGDDPPLR